MDRLRKLYLFVVSLFISNQKKPVRNKTEDVGGYWSFKKDILEKLDQYFFYIRYMRKRDPDAYDLYSRVGAAIVPDTTEYYYQTDKKSYGSLPPRWSNPDLRPGFGAVSYLSPNEDTFCTTKFSYFRRLYRTPAHVLKPVEGDLYEVTAFLQHDKNESNGFPVVGYVVVTNEAQIVPAQYITLVEHYGKKAQVRKATYGLLLDKSLDEGWSKKYDRPQNVQEMACFVFSTLADYWEQSQGGIRVTAKKGKVAAMFGVNLLRTPYFFSEREPVYSEEGHKKKIFHIVRTHERQTKTKNIYVKSHFRGLRDFIWNGYRVHLSMPETHHRDLLDFTLGAAIIDDDELPAQKYATSAQLGNLMAADING